ncbi:hypothetical protein PC9H_010162 [Pleurotus ostreatus]|uniref:Uncharacterized protein n=1 Tax=Pleurotus ostreatus TaxID=5322 RepID=A0A8H6ZSL5_PLEOS|nr:uncharacterized protein PC9H_010162 [Pleurotus ostreatus]KAF7424851.1 hypothetical protein PC9H_010162 [Pleurotus ostreatus]KAJ8692134.1 hypothetical protein PTI98_009472 [Pleurotus ostreatus]
MASLFNPDASPDPCSARLVKKSMSPQAAATPYDSPVRYFSPLNSVSTTYPTASNTRTAMSFNSVALPFVNDSTSAPNHAASNAVLSATSNVDDASSPFGFTSNAHAFTSTNSIIPNTRSTPSSKASDCGARRALPIGLFNHSPTPPTPIYSSTSPVPFQRASGHDPVEEVSSIPFSPPKQASSPRAWWDQTKLASLLALSREQKLTEIRQRFLRRLRPMVPLASNGSLPWNDIPALCATKAIQITGIPDCCPLPGFTARGISGLPTRFLTLYLKHLPDNTNQGIVFRRMKETDSHGMKAGKVPVIVCNPPHLHSRHSRARHLFVASDRIWIDRCGESRLSNAMSDSDFIPSDDDPHGPSAPFIAIKPKSTSGRGRRQQPHRVPLCTPSSSKPSHGVASVDSNASPKHDTQNHKRKRRGQRKAQVSQSEEEKTMKKGKGKARSRLQTSSEGEDDSIDGEDDTFHMKLRSQRG